MITVAVYIGGRLIPGSVDGVPDDPDGVWATDTLSMVWGRPNTTDQPEPSSCTFGLVRPVPVSWLRLGVDVVVTVVGPTTGPAALLFIGSITSLALRWDADYGPMVDVIADDILADLANRSAGTVGTWPSEPLDRRVGHVLASARQGVPCKIGPNIAGTMLAPQDVSTATAGPVLSDVTASVDGVLWSTGYKVSGVPVYAPALWIEDPGDRPALRRLAMPVATIVIVLDSAAIAAAAVTLDECVFDRDTAQFVQAVDDAVTGVAVTYYIPDPGSSTAPWTAVTVLSRDAAAESPDGNWGVRRIDLDTLLTTAVDAGAVGDRIVSRLRPAGAWRADRLAFDQATSPAVTDAQVFALLDTGQRHGLPLVIPLPEWAPVAELVGFLEGATATYTAGSWQLDLTVSSALSYGAADVAWNDIPDDVAWKWDAWDPAIDWDDLNGVGPPAGTAAIAWAE